MRHPSLVRNLCCALFSLSLAISTLPTMAGQTHKTTTSKKPTKEASRTKAITRKVAHKKQKATEMMADYSNLRLYSNAVMVLDQSTGRVLFEKNSEAVLPIASITKLMTAMVALDATPDLNEMLRIGQEDVDTLKGTFSRLVIGTELSREDMLHLALMSSENRAAHVLSRYYHGSTPAFVAAMNRKAQALGLQDTYFADPTGLTPKNVSSARDLARMVNAAQHYPLIRQFTTSSEHQVRVAGRTQDFRNTNVLVRNGSWDIGLSKTGFINEAGRCLVMQAWLNDKPTIIVLLDSMGKMTRIGDANRIKQWIENGTLVAHGAAS